MSYRKLVTDYIPNIVRERTRQIDRNAAITGALTLARVSGVDEPHQLESGRLEHPYRQHYDEDIPQEGLYDKTPAERYAPPKRTPTERWARESGRPEREWEWSGVQRKPSPYQPDGNDVKSERSWVKYLAGGMSDEAWEDMRMHQRYEPPKRAPREQEDTIAQEQQQRWQYLNTRRGNLAPTSILNPDRGLEDGVYLDGVWVPRKQRVSYKPPLTGPLSLNQPPVVHLDDLDDTKAIKKDWVLKEDVEESIAENRHSEEIEGMSEKEAASQPVISRVFMPPPINFDHLMGPYVEPTFEEWECKRFGSTAVWNKGLPELVEQYKETGVDKLKSLIFGPLFALQQPHIDTLMDDPELFCRNLEYLEWGNLKKPGRTKRNRTVEFVRRCRSLKVLKMWGAVLLTAKDIERILGSCSHLEKLCLTGVQPKRGQVTSEEFKEVMENLELGKNLRHLNVVDQMIDLPKDFWMRATRNRVGLEIMEGQTVHYETWKDEGGEPRKIRTWRNGRLAGLYTDFGNDVTDFIDDEYKLNLEMEKMI